MSGFFSSIKDKFGSSRGYDEMEPGDVYVDINTDASEEVRSKILVRPFMLDTFEDIKPILDSLREGHTIALVNIRPLKDKDISELKRAINKLKKTTDALNGEIAGFGDDYVVVAPQFAQIYKSKQTKQISGEE